MWVKKAQRSKPKIGKPCLFDSYQNIYQVAVNFRGKSFTHFRPKFHFHMPSSTTLLILENSSVTTRGGSTNSITSDLRWKVFATMNSFEQLTIVKKTSNLDVRRFLDATLTTHYRAPKFINTKRISI